MNALVTTAALISVAAACSLHAQSLTIPGGPDQDSLMKAQANDSLVAQVVSSRKGYLIRVPESASIDSGRSGWNPSKLFERRVYVLEGAGEIVITAYIGSYDAPEGAVKSAAYTYVDRDSVSTAGTIRSRTYYLETRIVRIDMIPYGIAMHEYLAERERIFNSFRWKPGANTTAIDVDEPPVFDPPNQSTMKGGLGG